MRTSVSLRAFFEGHFRFQRGCAANEGICLSVTATVKRLFCCCEQRRNWAWGPSAAIGRRSHRLIVPLDMDYLGERLAFWRALAVYQWGGGRGCYVRSSIIRGLREQS